MNTLKLTTRQVGNDRHFVTELLIDGSPLFSPTEYAIDLEALNASTTEIGEHFIITCTCGIHECAGIYRGIEVTRQGNRITWRITEPEPDRLFRFHTERYCKAIESGIAQARTLLQSSPEFIAGSTHIVPDNNAYFLGVYPLETARESR